MKAILFLDVQMYDMHLLHGQNHVAQHKDHNTNHHINRNYKTQYSFLQIQKINSPSSVSDVFCLFV